MGLSKTVSGKLLQSSYADRPDHIITITSSQHVHSVAVGSRILATTRDVLLVKEASYPIVRYFTQNAFEAGVLRKTDHSSWCPFKGRASYFSIGDDPMLENVVWRYEDPFEEVATIKEYYAFYQEKVQITQQ